MKILVAYLVWVEISCLALQTSLNIVILHDGTHTEYDSSLEWHQKLNLLFRDIKMRYPLIQLSSSTSLLTIERLRTESQKGLIGMITLARCTRGNTLESLSRKMYPHVPLLSINTEYCHERNGLLLTWVQVNLPCFVFNLQNWLRQVVRQQHSALLSTKLSRNEFMSPKCPFHQDLATHLMDAYQPKFKRNILDGQKIRVAVMNTSLSLLHGNFQDPRSLKYTGVLFDHMELLANVNNYTFELIIQEVERIGAKTDNGSWTGLLGLAASHAFDLSGYPMGYDPTRAEIVDWIYAAYDNNFGLIIPVPRIEKNWLASSQPYTYEVWALIFAVWIVYALLSTLYNRLEALLFRSVVSDRNLSGFWHFFNYQRVLFNQGGHDTQNQCSNRILMGFWCFLALIVVNLYTSVLIGYLTVPQVQPVVRNLADLARSTRIRMVYVNEQLVTKLFLNPSATDYFAVIGQRARKHPEDFVNAREEAVAKVAQGEHVLGEAFAPAYAAVAEDFKIHGRCRISLLPGHFHTVRATYFTPKGHPYWHYFYTSLSAIVEVGIWERMNKKLLQTSPCANLKTFVNTRTHSLSLPELTSPYSLYAIGLGFAVLTLLLEKIFCTRKNIAQ